MRIAGVGGPAAGPQQNRLANGASTGRLYPAPAPCGARWQHWRQCVGRFGNLHEPNPADAQLGVVAFLSNILREIIAIVLVPLLSKTLGPWPAISTAGATAMDTVLPVIAHSAGSESAAVAFISGVLLSLSVPLVVPVLLGFL